MKKDLEPLVMAEKKFKFIQKNYPNTDFALNSSYKLDLIKDYLASKEMYIGVHYIKKKVDCTLIDLRLLNEYDETSFIDEALHRLVSHYKIGLINSQKSMLHFGI